MSGNKKHFLKGYTNKKYESGHLIDETVFETDDTVTIQNSTDLLPNHDLHPDNITSTFSAMLSQINEVRESNNQPLLEGSEENGVFTAKENGNPICQISENESKFIMPAAKELFDKYLEKHADYTIIVEMCDIKAARELIDKFKGSSNSLKFSQAAIDKMRELCKDDKDRDFVNSLDVHRKQTLRRP